MAKTPMRNSRNEERPEQVIVVVISQFEGFGFEARQD